MYKLVEICHIEFQVKGLMTNMGNFVYGLMLTILYNGSTLEWLKTGTVQQRSVEVSNINFKIMHEIL
jgi:hypothetical protein